MIRQPRISPLFPYTTLSRSERVVGHDDTRGDCPVRDAEVSTARAVPDDEVARHHGVDEVDDSDSTARAPMVADDDVVAQRSEEHTSELQSQSNLVCRLLLDK